MKLKDFIEKRKEEMEWKRINGYYDGDPEKNGEYRTLKFFSNYIQLFVDIGANEGNFAKKILEYNNSIQIIAFEPNKTLIPIIQNTVKSNGICYQVAISDNEGIVKLYIHPQDNTTSSVFKRTEMMPTFANSMKCIEVPTSPLNNYEKKIDELMRHRDKGIFMKIDIEEGELLALRGAKAILEKSNPIFVMFEYSYGWKEAGLRLRDAFHLLDILRFRMFRITPLGFEEIRFFTLEMEDYIYCNYLAIKNFNLDSIIEPQVINSFCEYSLFYAFDNFWSFTSDVTSLS